MAAFKSLGFSASRDGRKGKADGIAQADFGTDSEGNARNYSVTLEAKSKRQDGKRISAATVNVSVIALHRDEYQSEHAIVVGPSFATTKGNLASIAQQIDSDRELTKAEGKPEQLHL